MSRLVMGRSFAACFAFLLALIAIPGQAQVSLDQFKPAPLASDGFALSRPQVLKHLEWGAVAVFDYAKDPLVLEIHRPIERELSVVRHHLVLHAGLALGLGKRLTVFGMLAGHAVMSGSDPTRFGGKKADGPGLGDTSVGGRYIVLSEIGGRWFASLEFIARLPTAEAAHRTQVYSGDQFGSYEPALVTELRLTSRFDLRLRAGLRIRRKVEIRELTLGTQAVYGLGARYRLAPGLYLHGELYGAAEVSGLGDQHRTPVEALVGPKYRAADWFFGTAAGVGIIRGYGAPDYRLVSTLGYAPIPKDKPISKPKDSDRDGLLDPEDRCPLDPEDVDEFEDEDGCSDPDNDRDGILDAADKCPLHAEDRDGFEDEHGCPDPDNDRDTILDVSDQCPLDAEDLDTFEDKNGCPDPDNDADLVLDVDDACALVPGVKEQKGCPAKRLDIEGGRLLLLGRVEFAVDKDKILESSNPVLIQVSETLAASPNFKRVRIEGHTDSVGNDARNLDLSTRRARSVARWLVAHGIAEDRLEAWGCGETRAVSPNATLAGRQENRRVEFHVTDPAPSEPKSTKGCVQTQVR